jgi:hypothetical protein
MAGSYGHVLDETGMLGDATFVVDMLENGGDVYEAVEEMYGMIHWLAAALAAQSNADDRTTRQQLIEQAQEHYKDGLRVAGVRPFDDRGSL